MTLGDSIETATEVYESLGLTPEELRLLGILAIAGAMRTLSDIYGRERVSAGIDIDEQMHEFAVTDPNVSVQYNAQLLSGALRSLYNSTAATTIAEAFDIMEDNDDL